MNGHQWIKSVCSNECCTSSRIQGDFGDVYAFLSLHSHRTLGQLAALAEAVNYRVGFGICTCVLLWAPFIHIF